ncbi:MAG TPA: NosD domain-containing protein [Rudaea sp.]|nr:NosD domain-containing protein [Rudaea sp.]
MPRLPHRFALVVLAASLAIPTAISARTRVVHPGDSIASALQFSQSGDRIVVQPGVYHEGAAGDLNALTVTVDGIELIGNSRPGRPVVLENAGGQSYGIWVSPADSTGAAAEANDESPPCATSGAVLRHFALTGFTVRGFDEHGVHLACVDGFALADNISDGNLVYGLFPILSKHGLLARNEVVNTTTDAAVYVGQSDDVLVTRNRVHDSLLGIEVQNSRHCAVTANDVFGNTLGILLDVGVDKVIKTQETTFVGFNHVHDNNRANSASPDDFIAVLPPGIGVLLVGADTSVVSRNNVSANGFAGIANVSLCLGLALAGQPCAGIDVDPWPDGNRITNNIAQGNGGILTGIPELDALSADLVWDGSGADNCWASNTFGTAVPPVLPACL